MQRRRRISFGRWLALTLATAVAWTAAGTAEATEARLRTVSLMTYHSVGEGLMPSKSFTGVVLNGRYVVTSQWALEQGHRNPFTGREGELSRVQGVLRVGEEVREFDLAVWDSPRMIGDELVLLEVVESDREALSRVIGHLPQLGSLEDGLSARLVGVAAPLGVEEVNERTVPPPLELSASWEQMLRRRGTLGVPLEPTYPPQMVGAGLWNDHQELLGILVREDRGWWLVDASMVEELGELAGLDWDEPERFVEFGGPELRRPDPRPRAELRGIYELLDRNGMQMKLDRNLVDHVNQPQADLIMAMIAAGEYERALNLLDRIEPLVHGQLMEQMTYRRALTLVLKGRADDALRGLGGVEQMEDDLARARGRLLREVLLASVEGRLEGADPGTPDGLVESSLRVLGELERDFAEQLQQLHARVGTEPIELTLVELERIRREVREYRQAWPGYFAPMLERIEAFRDELVP